MMFSDPERNFNKILRIYLVVCIFKNSFQFNNFMCSTVLDLQKKIYTLF
jgi:hypothetical protein